jgi:hypothetical protein
MNNNSNLMKNHINLNQININLHNNKISRNSKLSSNKNQPQFTPYYNNQI